MVDLFGSFEDIYQPNKLFETDCGCAGIQDSDHLFDARVVWHRGDVRVILDERDYAKIGVVGGDLSFHPSVKLAKSSLDSLVVCAYRLQFHLTAHCPLSVDIKMRYRSPDYV